MTHPRRLDTGEDIGAPIRQVGAGVSWAGDQTIFYCRVDRAWRPFQVWRHALGSDPADDVVVLTEDDDMFWLAADESRDREWIVLTAGSRLTTEVWLIPAARPGTAPRSVAGRTPGLEYLVEQSNCAGASPIWSSLYGLPLGPVHQRAWLLMLHARLGHRSRAP